MEKNSLSIKTKDIDKTINSRKQRGKVDDTAMFPAPPTKTEMPENYTELLDELKSNIANARLKAILATNSTMIFLYWDIGKCILDKQKNEGWGAKTIDRLSLDLKKAFPDMQGFSPRNLKYMRAFASVWPNIQIVQEVLAQLPWYHNITLLEKLKTAKERLWYARKAYEHGWSRNILAIQINTNIYHREGKAQNNFSNTLPAADSDMAVQVFKDPYLLDFLGTDAPRREKELEQGLIDHIQSFLLEMGQGFAFVGRQVHLELGDSDYYIDLLFYHLKLRRYIVLEIKARKFEVGDGSQLGMYMTAVDKLLKHEEDKPTLGLLLVRSKSGILVEYALDGMNKPIGVATWETQLTQSLPDNLQASLPTVEELEAELKRDNGDKINSKKFEVSLN
jgi:predicted nuclease of restriction endonuclease-like (RecB) superfamily